MKQQSDTQLRIYGILNEIDSLRKVELHLKAVDADLKLSYEKIDTADRKLKRELKDVEDLEKIGIKSLFYKTLGSKEDQLEKERQEYLSAALHYKELTKASKLLEFEKKILSKKTVRLDELTTKLEALKRSREREILNSGNDSLKNQLLELSKKLETNSVSNRGVNEALLEGEKSLRHLRNVIAFLRKAKDWGRWDMYSKNRQAGYMKHQAIDKAVQNLTIAQHQLNKFSRELSDLGDNYISFNLKMGQFNKFMDFFFDNLISDWIIQQRIKSSLLDIENTYSQVQRIVLDLKKDIDNIQANSDSLLRQKESLLMS